MGSTRGDDAAHLGSPEIPRQRRNRGSGGFLLDTPIGHPRAASSFLDKLRPDQKGKRKSVTPEANSRQWKDKVDNEQDKSPFASPLSKEVIRADAAENAYSESSTTYSASRDGSVSQNGRPVSSSTRPVSSVGLDSDPAQIVDMALRLSERRRKQAVERNLAPTESPAKKNVGIVNGSAIQSRLPSHSVDHDLATPEKQSATISTKRGSLVAALPEYPIQSANPSEAIENVLEISKATLARVDKTKTYIELAYEHRRLLPHLPPIRRPGAGLSNGGVPEESKAYNPLQYARNRKLRLREKNGLSAESDGWFDVAKVREWVDAAINSHTKTKHDPAECVRLPPLSANEENRESKDHSNPNSPQQGRQIPRPRRPKSDWVTHPANLLADAYWLEQGLNKTKIQDRDNNPIYPPDTHFHYAGWREQATPVKVPESLQQQSPVSTDIKSVPVKETSPLFDAPELPKFRSTHRHDDVSRNPRGSRNLKKSLFDDAKDSTRKALEIFEQSSSSSSSSDSASDDSNSDSDNQPRGRRKGFTKAFKFDLPGGDPFSSHVSSSNQASDHSTSRTNDSSKATNQSSVQRSLQEKRLSELRTANARSEQSLSGKGVSRPEELPGDSSVRSGDYSRSSGEYRTLSPSSPTSQGLPSIAINLSPTTSRSPSPAKKNRTGFRSLREKHLSRDKKGVESTDFAEESFKSHSRDASTDADESRTGSGNDSRGTSPFNKNRRGSSPYEAPLDARANHRSSVMSRASAKSNPTSFDHHSRIRGMFKGGRIAEIVGNEVSKVGDYIWKREPPTGRHPTSISESSLRSNATSDSDEERHDNTYKTPPRNVRTSVSSDSSRTDPRTSLEGSEQKSQYHNPNLPSFTSPFQRDREKQNQKSEVTTPGTPQRNGGDHISLQVAQQRTRSRSPRLDRLAPPRLDTSGSATDRRGSYGFGASLDLTKSRSASQAYNNAIGSESSQPRKGGSTADLTKQTDEAAKGMTTADKAHTLSKAELMRVRTLLMISIVKSNSIMQSQENNIVNANHQRRQSITRDIRLSQCKQHADAAHELFTKLSEHSDAFRSKLHHFSETTVGNLHSEMQRLEDHIENTLTPRARVAADQAGELSMKLTTTSTLAIKGLNDTISEAFRLRKRGPFRWLRRLGYGAIEWGVVSLLWIIWAIVTVIRIILGTVKFGGRFVRWMLWVD